MFFYKVLNLAYNFSGFLLVFHQFFKSFKVFFGKVYLYFFFVFYCSSFKYAFCLGNAKPYLSYGVCEILVCSVNRKGKVVLCLFYCLVSCFNRFIFAFVKFFDCKVITNMYAFGCFCQDVSRIVQTGFIPFYFHSI